MYLKRCYMKNLIFIKKYSKFLSLKNFKIEKKFTKKIAKTNSIFIIFRCFFQLILSIEKNGSIFAYRKSNQQSIHKIPLQSKINVFLAQKTAITYFSTTLKIANLEKYGGFQNKWQITPLDVICHR